MYTQRFRNLVTRLTNTPDAEQQVEWYVNGLPTELAFQCRLGPQSTMAEVISTAEKYETARRTAKKKKKLKSHRAMSSSSDDDSGTSSDSSSEDEEITRRHKGKKKVKRRSSSADDSSSSEEEEKSKRITSPKRRVKAGKSSMDALLREMADLKVQIANVKQKRKNPSAPRHNLWCSNCHSNGHTKDDCKMAKGSGNQVNWVEESTPSADESYYAEGADGSPESTGKIRFDPQVITIPNSPEGWPSDSAWDTFGVSTRSRGETKTSSTKEEKKKKGKKQVEVSIETSSDSDSEPVKRDLYKDDISSIVLEALKKQSQGNIDATPGKEVRLILEASTLPPDVSRTETISLSTKLDYDFVKNLSETPAQISMLQLIVHSPQVLKQLNTWSRDQRKTSRGLRRRKKIDESIAAYAITEEDRGAPEVDIEIRGCLIQHVPLDSGSGVNIMTESTATRLGFTTFAPCTKFLRMADQSRKRPLGILNQVQTLFGGISFLLNYVVLKPEDESGYEILIGRPWLYGAKAVNDWAKQRVGFPVTGQRKPMRINWGLVPHEGETSSQDSDYYSTDSGEDSAYDSYESSVTTYGLILEDIQHFSSDHQVKSMQISSHQKKMISSRYFQVNFLQCYEADATDLEAYHEEIRALYISGLESESEKPVQFQSAEIYNLPRPLAEGEGNLDITPEPPQLESKKGGDSAGLNGKFADLVEEAKRAIPDQPIPEREDTDIAGATTFKMTEGMIRKEDGKSLEVWPGKNLRVNARFTDAERDSYRDFLKEYRDVFAFQMSDLKGILPEIGTHRIDLQPGSVPVRQRQYRLNEKYSLLVKENIDSLLDARFIYPVLSSDWVSPIVVIPKKQTGKIRVCQDFRRLNEAALKDHHPLPFTDVILDQVAGFECYSFLDGFSGYNQVFLRAEDCDKTTFTTDWGTFAYKRKSSLSSPGKVIYGNDRRGEFAADEQLQELDASLHLHELTTYARLDDESVLVLSEVFPAWTLEFCIIVPRTAGEKAEGPGTLFNMLPKGTHRFMRGVSLWGIP
ncbi:hypothetical protein R1sor_023045 [Riccia sorocarpa]|uniref:Reverse transcriptase domain-containing protein n=1 Tax=Riccia sorocarpa TaxID=122646 RepID=A0ABD3GSI6_9MARC